MEQDPEKDSVPAGASSPPPDELPKTQPSPRQRVLWASRAAGHHILMPAPPESTPGWKLIPCPHGDHRDVPKAALPLGFFPAGSSSPAPMARRSRLLGPAVTASAPEGSLPPLQVRAHTRGSLQRRHPQHRSSVPFATPSPARRGWEVTQHHPPGSALIALGTGTRSHRPRRRGAAGTGGIQSWSWTKSTMHELWSCSSPNAEAAEGLKQPGQAGRCGQSGMLPAKGCAPPGQAAAKAGRGDTKVTMARARHSTGRGHAHSLSSQITAAPCQMEGPTGISLLANLKQESTECQEPRFFPLFTIPGSRDG